MAKVLVVDDEALTLEMLSTFLQISGHDALTAIDVRQGWSVLGYEKPEAVLLDIMLPDGNGLDMCRQIKQNPQTAHLSIIIISAHAPPMIEEAEQAGADDYLAKPIRLKDLQTTLNQVLNSQPD